MTDRLLLFLLVTFPTALAADEPTTRIVDVRTGEDVSVDDLAGALASDDVVFLGEEHDNAAGHRLHHAIVAAVAERRKDVVLSMEMFERDVQGVVDDWLRGRIDDETFRANARPWSKHGDFYQPFLDLARDRNLDVIAANVPRPIAGRVAKGESPSLADRRFLPRVTTAPPDRYREAFVAAMGDHAGTNEDGAIDRYYASQCLKDDAMAEAIVDHLATRPHRRPLVVHVCGSFHSDHGLGTVSRVLSRSPLSRVSVLSMEAVDDVAAFDPATVERDRCHWLLVVPKPEQSAKATSDAGA